MAEQRTKLGTILLRDGRKTVAVIDLFCASQWPQHGGKQGLLRLRANGRMVQVNGDKYSFFTLPKALAWAADEFGVSLGFVVGAPAGQQPDIPRGSHVRVPSSEVAGQTFYTRTCTNTPPVQLADGTWRVGVFIPGKGWEWVLAENVEVIRRRL